MIKMLTKKQGYSKGYYLVENEYWIDTYWGKKESEFVAIALLRKPHWWEFWNKTPWD